MKCNDINNGHLPLSGGRGGSKKKGHYWMKDERNKDENKKMKMKMKMKR